MDQKLLFIADARRALLSLAELCDRYGISRKTGYKWILRYREDGPQGLCDRSRRPRSCPHATPADTLALLLDARRHHPTWEPEAVAYSLAKAPRLGMARSQHRLRPAPAPRSRPQDAPASTLGIPVGPTLPDRAEQI
jgi:transposase-like protein